MARYRLTVLSLLFAAGGSARAQVSAFDAATDFDYDGVPDSTDTCPLLFDPFQADAEPDGVGDLCDVCTVVADPSQDNLDGDLFGDACDSDADGDAILDTVDNCDFVPNPLQFDTDMDGEGDVCDDDDDGDGTPDDMDACRLGTGMGACDDDEDFDGIPGSTDNCPSVSNFIQTDIDMDGVGNLCDVDLDGDGVDNIRDNCVAVPNASQVDSDRDGLGDASGFAMGAESCDVIECLFVQPLLACLSPNTAFSVASFAYLDGLTAPVVGNEVGIILVSNRPGVVHDWAATLLQVPAGGMASLTNAMGSGSTRGESAQVTSCGGPGNCSNIALIPDVPGTWTVRITATLPGGMDPMSLGPGTATTDLNLTVFGGAPGDGGLGGDGHSLEGGAAGDGNSASGGGDSGTAVLGAPTNGGCKCGAGSSSAGWLVGWLAGWWLAVRGRRRRALRVTPNEM